MGFWGLVAGLTVAYVVVARLERMPALRARVLASPRPYLLTDAAWYAIAVGATAISVFVFRPQLAKLAVGPLADALRALPIVVQLGLAVVVFDFVSFVVHRGMHRYDVLWRIHKVHHSSLQLDGFATTRIHMVENMLRFVPGQAVLFALGLPASVVAPAVAIAALYGVSNHSNLGIDLTWLEPVMVTPRLHHRHHVPSTTLANYGTIFSIWDRLGHTLVRRDTAANERYGVPGEIDTYPQRFLAAFRQPLLEHLGSHRARRTASDDAASHELVGPHRSGGNAG